MPQFPLKNGNNLKPTSGGAPKIKYENVLTTVPETQNIVNGIN
jgi:hypothetical protein